MFRRDPFGGCGRLRTWSRSRREQRVQARSLPSTLWFSDSRGHLLHRGPDALHVFVVFELLQEFADLGARGVVEFGVILREVADFRGDNGPAVLLEPGADRMHGGAFGDEAGAGVVFGNVVVLLVRKRLEIVGARFDGGGFAVDVAVGVVRLDEADVLEEKLVAAGLAEHAPLEKVADLGRGALMIVGVDFDNDGHLMRRVALEYDVLHRGLFAADAGALGDGALDGVAGQARLLDRK